MAKDAYDGATPSEKKQIDRNFILGGMSRQEKGSPYRSEGVVDNPSGYSRSGYGRSGGFNKTKGD